MEEIVVNALSADGMRRVRWLSDRPVDLTWAAMACPRWRRGLAVTTTGLDEAIGVHWAECVWPLCDPMHDGSRWYLGWRLLEGQRVSQAIQFAAEVYAQGWGRAARFAWMRSMPKGAEEGLEVCGCTLVAASRVLEQCVFVGG